MKLELVYSFYFYTVSFAIGLSTTSGNPFLPFDGPPTFQEEYRDNFVPEVIRLEDCRLHIVAPDTPYVAAAGPHCLYFIDTRFDPEAAAHVKRQIEARFVSTDGYRYTQIDEIDITASVRDIRYKEPRFVFDPAFVGALFEEPINRRNPDAKLPNYFPGDSNALVFYNITDIYLKRQDKQDDQIQAGTVPGEESRSQQHLGI